MTSTDPLPISTDKQQSIAGPNLKEGTVKTSEAGLDEFVIISRSEQNLNERIKHKRNESQERLVTKHRSRSLFLEFRERLVSMFSRSSSSKPENSFKSNNSSNSREPPLTVDQCSLQQFAVREFPLSSQPLYKHPPHTDHSMPTCSIASRPIRNSPDDDVFNCDDVGWEAETWNVISKMEAKINGKHAAVSSNIECAKIAHDVTDIGGIGAKIRLKHNSSWSSFSSDGTDHEPITCHISDMTSHRKKEHTTRHHSKRVKNNVSQLSGESSELSICHVGRECVVVDGSSSDVTKHGACEGGSLKRFYHVFKKGELDALIGEHVTDFHVARSYWEHANWCVEAIKIKAKS